MWAIAQRAIHFVYAVWLELVLFFILTALLALWGFPLVYSTVIFALFFVVVVPLNSTLVSHGILRGIVDIRHDRWSVWLIVVGVALLVIWHLSLDSIFFLLYKWDSRIIAAGALIALASCPVLLIINTPDTNTWAETMAVYAYFFLVMTVALQIVEYKRHPNEHAKD